MVYALQEKGNSSNLELSEISIHCQSNIFLHNLKKPIYIHIHEFISKSNINRESFDL